MPENPLFLPFRSREQINFGHEAVMGLDLESVATVAAEIEIAGYTREGIFIFHDTHAGNGAVESELFRIPDIPIALSIRTLNAAVELGDYWVTIWLTINEERVFKLGAGYVSRQSVVSYPYVQSASELRGGGKFKIYSPTNPGAGANITVTVPEGEHWIIQWITMRIVASATAATRRCHLVFRPDTSQTGLDIIAQDEIVAYDDYRLNFAPLDIFQLSNDGGHQNSSIPKDIHIPSGGTIATNLTNIQAGDQISDVDIYVEQYLEL